MTTNHRYADNAGFTLVEMLVAVAIAGVVGMAALTVFISANRTTTAQTELTQAQQSVRASLDRLAQHVRIAGFGLPERRTFTLEFDGNEFDRAVTVTNSDTGPDTLTLVGIGHVAGFLNDFQKDGCNDLGATCLSLTSNEDFKTNGTFNPLRRYISLGGAKALAVQGVEGSNKIILTKPLADLSQDYFKMTPPPTVFILQALRYSIATDLPVSGCSAARPCLAVQDFTELSGKGRQVLAQGIEDLQIGVFTSPDDAAIEETATFSNDTSATSPRITALRINLLGKAATADPSSFFQRPDLEDRTAKTDPDSFVPDSFRRRVLTTIVKIRNPRPDS